MYAEPRARPPHGARQERSRRGEARGVGSFSFWPMNDDVCTCIEMPCDVFAFIIRIGKPFIFFLFLDSSSG